jgi:hypothetical protein
MTENKNKNENIQIDNKEIKVDESIVVINNFKNTVKRFFGTYNDKIIEKLEVNKKIILLKTIIDIDKKINNLNKIIKKINTV